MCPFLSSIERGKNFSAIKNLVMNLSWNHPYTVNNREHNLSNQLVEVMRVFRAIPESDSELFRVISNQSKKRSVSCLIKNGQKSFRITPIQSE